MAILSIPDGRKSFWQWDLNQKLIVSDEACREVHFFNGANSDTLVCRVFEKDGHRLVNVPNVLLQSNVRFQAYAYIVENDDRHTRYYEAFNVLSRPKPVDYIYTETEVMTVKSYVENALEEAKESGDFNGDKGDPFTYEDFTEEQLAGLKGEKGDKGDPFTYEDFTEADKQEIVNEFGAVSYNEQTLTDEQKAQARVNIGAAAEIIDTETILYSEQELIRGYVTNSGVPASNPNHYYFSMPSYGVKSVTITPLMAGANGSISYLVFVDKDGKATPYAGLKTTTPATVEFDGVTEGTLYFNAYTDETVSGVTYNYVKEATVKRLVNAASEADLADTNARIDELETAINSGIVTKTIVYSEQELISGYVGKTGTIHTNPNHYYFSMPSYGVKSVTITPVKAGASSSISYLVFVDKEGNATSYANINKIEPTTAVFDGVTEGTLYFNAYTDEGDYVYVKEATLECLIGAVQPTNDSNNTTAKVSSINNHCVNKPYTFSGKTALFFGDSITYGTTGSGRTENGFPKLFSEKVGMTFTNHGKNGSLLGGTADSLTRIPATVKSEELTSDFVFISGGVNDWQMAIDLTAFRTGVADLCTYLKENYTGEVIFITPINHGGWNPKETPVAELQEYRDIITELAVLNGYSVVQGNLFNFPTPAESADYITAILGDKLHPTELGYQLYAKQLATVLC